MSTQTTTPEILPPVAIDPEMHQTALTTVERARAIVVTDNDSRTQAGEVGVAIAGMYKKVEEWFAPMKRAAAATHKAICNAENGMLNPLAEMKRHLSVQIGSFDQAEERRRKVEEERLQEEARKAAQVEADRLAQETAIADAIALEAEGDKAGADAVLNNPKPQPVYVQPVVVARTTPKTAGVSGREKWTYRITDFAALPDDFKMVNDVELGQVVRAMKSKTKIPGVEVFPERGASFRG